ncbi:MAG: sulfatase-like hydrolase/transferase [Rikenellaceae bacterium]
MYNNPKLWSGAALILSLSTSNATSAQEAKATDRKPANILFVISDQLSWQAIETYGDRSGSTPTVDSLGRNGVAFSQAYTVVPLSMPARASLWSGLYPHTTGIESNGRNWQNSEFSDDLHTMGSIFSENGYECVHFGKMHDGGALRGFECADETMEIKVPNEFENYPLTYDSYRDIYTTRESVKYLLSTKGKEDPFFCVVDLNNPHNICDYIGAHQGEHTNPDKPEYQGVLPELPSNFVDPYAAERPHPVQYLCCSHIRQSQTSEWNQENYQHYLAAYYYYANRMDKDLATVLDALRQSGHADNTLIVFMADHGEGMASKRMVTKQGTPYDQTTRVPLIFFGKGVKQSDKLIDKPIVNVSIDMIPTLCEYAGIDTPRTMPGVSQFGWIAGTQKRDTREYICTEWTTEWGYTVSPFRMIRSHDYKYIKYLECGDEELFDMNNDPDELINLADDKKYSKVLKKHRDYLAEHIEQTNDNFYLREVYWNPEGAQHQAGYHNHTGPAIPQMK